MERPAFITDAHLEYLGIAYRQALNYAVRFPDLSDEQNKAALVYWIVTFVESDADVEYFCKNGYNLSNEKA